METRERKCQKIIFNQNLRFFDSKNVFSSNLPSINGVIKATKDPLNINFSQDLVMNIDPATVWCKKRYRYNLLFQII